VRQFRTVLGFEFNYFIRSRVYVVVTIIVVAVLAVLLSFPNIQGLFAGEEGPEGALGGQKSSMAVCDMSGNSRAAANYIAGVLTEYDVTPKDGLDEESAKRLVEDGEYDDVILLVTPADAQYITKSMSVYNFNHQIVGEVLSAKYKADSMAALGITPAQAAEIIASHVNLEVVETGKSQAENFFYTYVLIFLLYMAILLYGQMVATGVAAEKSSRAMELLITSAKPTNLMFGKVLGSGLAGLMQMSVFLGSATLFYRLNEAAWGDNEIIGMLFGMPTDILMFCILFFLLGYFMYSFMYGALGSLASRTEDVNTSTLPVTLCFIAAFFTSFYGMTTGVDTALVVVCSYIPFTSPTVMFVRICMSNVPWWEIAISVGILVGFTGFIGWLAARIYRIGVLMYGKPPKLKELIKIMRSTQ